MSSSRCRVTYGQLEQLAEILSANRDVALGYNKASQARARSRQVWERAATTLNSMGEGAQKTWKEWSMYWVDYKAKLKKKAAVVRADMGRTRGGPSSAPDINDVEERFLRMLGPNYGLRLPGVRVEPLPDEQPVEQPVPVPERVPVLETQDSATDTDVEPAPWEAAHEYYAIWADDLEEAPAEVTTPARATRARCRRCGGRPISDAHRTIINDNREINERLRGLLEELRRLTDLLSHAMERLASGAGPRAG